jgi:uncharacterized protein YggT (Ycf19 family)
MKMAVERKEQVQVVRGDGYEHQNRVVEFAPSNRQIIGSRVSELLGLLTTVIVGLISFRFVLMLLATNVQNGFVDLIYDITEPLVSPFVGIVNTIPFNSGAVIDFAALIAIVVYVLAALALTELFIHRFHGYKAQTRSNRH